MFLYAVPNVIVGMHLTVRLSGGLFIWSKLTSTLEKKKHYSSETVRRSILFFKYAVTNILQLCTSLVRLSVDPFIWSKLTLKLRNFVVIYSFAITFCCIFIPHNLFVSLTVRPGGAYVLRPDTFLVYICTYHWNNQGLPWRLSKAKSVIC